MNERAAVRAIAPAKVNLFLEVHGRRGDGYHELITLMAALQLSDEVEVRPHSEAGITLAVTGPGATADVPRDASNLVWRAAAAALERRARLEPTGPGVGVELSLHKRIPSRAGLGGGSSDAAAAIVASERALALPPDPEWRRRTLARLGADCVFFHDVGRSGLALCEGIGERVTPRGDSPPEWVVLCLTPEVHCPTAEVFAALGERFAPPTAASRWGDDPARLSAAEARRLIATDLEEAALTAVPELRRWRELLDEQGGAHLRLSGSGSSFFALYDDPREAAAELDRFLAETARRGQKTRFHQLTRTRSGGVELVENDS